MSAQLHFTSALARPELLAVSTLQAITSLDPSAREVIEVTDIDPEAAGSIAFCERYGYAVNETANCVLVGAFRAGNTAYAACVVPPDTRADLNGAVRRHLNARRVSMLDRDFAIAETGMEYNSITAVGLPPTWRVLVDSRIAQASRVIMGSGRIQAKIQLPGALFVQITSAEVLVDLGR